MTERVLLGMLTPSSNTVLEPVTSAMLAALPRASAHFGRFKVTEISLKGAALGQFDLERILEAARLLADARVQVIAWSGTSAGWLGFDTDEALCARITEATGIPATTSVLALNELLAETGARRIGLATPYIPEIQQRILANYRAAGYDCVAERHLGESVNYAFSEVSAETMTGMVGAIAGARPDAITTFCTNLRAAPLVPQWEATWGIPVYDTIAVVVRKALLLAGADPRRITGWGRLFRW